jgi:predicted transcriptional regulator YdeE
LIELLITKGCGIAPCSYNRKHEVAAMSKRENELEKDNMMNKEIEFTDYAPLDRDYTKQELAEIYKRIIKDISNNPCGKAKR